MAQPLRALIVEDNPSDAELLVLALRRAGFAPVVECVDNAADFKRQLRADWDLVFSDYSLPQFSGLDALMLLRESGLDLPFIIVSGTIGEETAIEAMRKGASDYLLKDRLGRLGPAVTHALEQGQLRREHGRANEALAESEERFRQLAENIQEVFWIAEKARRRFLYVSPAFERVWGVPSHDLLTHPALWIEAVHPDDRKAVERGFGKNPDGDYDLDYRIVHRDGSIRWIHDKAFPVRNAEGKVYRLVGVAEDITERHRMEERFLRAQRMEVIGSLTSGISHDLNNILGSMLMAAGLVKARTTQTRDRDMLATVERGAERGARMITQLLTFSRGVEGTRSALRPGVVLEELGGLIRATFPRNIELRVSVQKDLLNLVADATQLHQVLMNLSVNARDAMPSGGSLTVAAENVLLSEEDAQAQPGAQPGWYVVISVSDTGDGIEPAIIDRVFDPFFTTKEVGKGTGLGLSSVLGIVKSHNGFVTVASKVGSGTIFRVHLPASGESAPPFTSTSAGPFPTGNDELVMVVDDEADALKVTVNLLEANRYRVLPATCGEDALTLFLHHADSVRVVLTNIHMPGMGGLALLRALRVLKNLKVGFIVASGANQAELRPEFDRLGVVEVLAKPFPPSNLLRAVARAIEVAQAVEPGRQDT